MDVSHEPIEDVDVAMDRDVDIIGGFRIREVLFEVFHIVNQQLFVTPKVLILLLVLITNMNNDSRATQLET
jgi:hypothetical protein